MTAPETWPKTWQNNWNKSPIVRNWPKNMRNGVKLSLNLYRDFSHNEQDLRTAFLEWLDKRYAPKSALTQREYFVYGLAIVAPNDDLVGLRLLNRNRRDELYKKKEVPSKKKKSRRKISLPLSNWPQHQRNCWMIFKEKEKNLSSSRLFALENTWGCWLFWLQKNNHDLTSLTFDLADQYTDLLDKQDQSHVTIASYLERIYRMGSLFYPEADLAWLREAYLTLKKTAIPKRNKWEKYVSIEELAILGIELMNEARGYQSKSHALQFRDGLAMALLAFRPKRIGNLGSISLEKNIIYSNEKSPLAFMWPESKNGDSVNCDIPELLKPFVKEYLDYWRPVLLMGQQKDDFWIGRDGKQFMPGSFTPQLGTHTIKKFEKSINVHAFRHNYTTTMLEENLQLIDHIRCMLDHRDRKSLDHYVIEAKTFNASRKLNQIIDNVIEI